MKFWVVTKATEHSGLTDICFETDVKGMMLQALGGLKPDDVVGVYTSQDSAINHANTILKEFSKLNKLYIQQE